MAEATRTFGSPWPRALLGLVVALYLGIVLVAPLGGLVVEAISTASEDGGATIDMVALREAFGRSLLLALIAAVANGAIGVGAGIVIARHRFIGRGVLDALTDIPLAVSPVMIGLSFLILFGRDGWLEPITTTFGMQVVFAFPGMALATLFVTLPYTTREVVYVLEEIGTSEEDAARTLGASTWLTFAKVTLPNLRYALGYGVLMTTARALGEFGAVLVIGGSIAGVTQTATTLVHDALEERLNVTAYAVAGLLSLVSIVLLFAL
ncbi:MAG: ABC transporter permease subunit, partial [Myxococcales bacterium]|nr:ABC transporter permease subunit [Myxococcales bacterium]